MRFHPGQQLAHTEGLRHVVVGPELKAEDRVDLLVAGGEDDDGGLGAPRAESAEEFKPVDPREAYVEDQQVGGLLRADLKALVAGRRHERQVPLTLQRHLKGERDGWIVFNNKDRGCHAPMLHP